MCNSVVVALGTGVFSSCVADREVVGENKFDSCQTSSEFTQCNYCTKERFNAHLLEVLWYCRYVDRLIDQLFGLGLSMALIAYSVSATTVLILNTAQSQ